MRVFFRSALFAIALLWALPARAQLLDQMLTVQAATTSAGKGSDSSTVRAQSAQELWSARTFAVSTSKSCVAEGRSAIGIANSGTGITNIEISNARGEARITWSFGSGIPAARFPYSAFEVTLVNTSRVADSKVAIAAVLTTNVTDLRIGYPGVRVDRKLSPAGKVVTFTFDSASPSLLKHPATIIRSLTLRLSSPTTCDASFAVHSARLVSLPTEKSKPKRGGTADRVPTEENDPFGRQSSSSASSSSSTPPTTNPCDADPTVPDQIKRCEDEHHFVTSGCSKWECSCLPSADNKSYFIVGASAGWDNGSEEMDGKTCTNNVCGGVPGTCSESGECIPSQFYGYNNPSISIGAEGISFWTRRSGTDLTRECFDRRQHPSGKQLCDMTVAQVEQMFLASMKVGAPCPLSGDKIGICSNTGQCVPDASGAYVCKNKVDCSPCGQSGNICWKKECISRQDASRKLCETTHLRGGGFGICTQCYAMLKLNPDGVCGTGVLAPDPRGVSMDGATCSRYQSNQLLKGQCADGQCVLQSPSSASSSSSSSSASSRR